jgi:hypothetical protein
MDPTITYKTSLRKKTPSTLPEELLDIVAFGGFVFLVITPIKAKTSQNTSTIAIQYIDA